MSSEGAISNSQIVERVDKTTRTGRRIAEIKLQSGRWIQIWDQNFDKTPNQFFTAAIVGAVCSWNSELRAVDGKVGYYKQPSDLHIVGSQTHTTVPNYQHRPAPAVAAIQPNIQPQPAAPQPQQQIRADYAAAQAEKDKRIKEMADRRDSLVERQIAAMEKMTEIMIKLDARMEKMTMSLLLNAGCRSEGPYPDGIEEPVDELNTVSQSDLDYNPPDEYDEAGY